MPTLAVALADADPRVFTLLWWGQRVVGVTVELANVKSGALAAVRGDAWRRKAPRRRVP